MIHRNVFVDSIEIPPSLRAEILFINFVYLTSRYQQHANIIRTVVYHMYAIQGNAKKQRHTNNY